jgi:hypothetical protein
MATVCVAEPMVKTTLPVGTVEPVAGVTVAVSMKDAPVVREPPPGVMDRAVVVATTGMLTVSLIVLEELVEKVAVP